MVAMKETPRAQLCAAGKAVSSDICTLFEGHGGMSIRIRPLEAWNRVPNLRGKAGGRVAERQSTKDLACT